MEKDVYCKNCKYYKFSFKKLFFDSVFNSEYRCWHPSFILNNFYESVKYDKSCIELNWHNNCKLYEEKKKKKKQIFGRNFQ